MKNIFLIIFILMANTSVFAQGIPSYISSNGLLGWYPFNGNSSDESGNGNDGVLQNFDPNGIVNGPILDFDRNGAQNSSYSFPGAKDNIRIAPPIVSSVSNEMGVSLWVKLDSLSPSGGIFRKNFIGGNQDQNHLFFDSAKQKLRIYNQSSHYATYNFNNLNKWNYLCWNLEDSIVELYINGTSQGIQKINFPFNSTSGDVFFGGTRGWGFINGNIDDVGIWNRSLSPCEVCNIYNEGVDTILPTVSTKNDTIYLNFKGTSVSTLSLVNNGSSDNCGIASMRLSDSIFDCSDVGFNTIYLIVTDWCGNIDSASAVITVQDTIKPTVLTQNVTVSLDASGIGSITVSDVDSGSTDNCSIATRTLSKISFDCSEVGANTIYLIVTDVNGNIDSASAAVTVQDIIKPTVLTQNVTVSLDANGAGSVTVADIDNGSTDNCSIASRTLSKTSFDCSNVGANTIYLIVTDVNGNIDSASAVVTVQDVIKPTVLTQNVTVSLDANGASSVTVADIDNGSTDNCSIASSTLSKSTFDCSEVGANTIYLIVTDANGNIDSASAVVTVQDTIKPTVLTQNVTVSLDASGAGSVTVADIDNGSNDNCTIATRTLSKSTFDCSEVGANSIYLIVTDVNGNIDSASAVVTVQDTIKPTVVTTPSDIALGYCDANYTYAIPTGDDNCGVTVTQIAGLPPGSTFPVGLTLNTFEISDPSGNTVTTSFTVDIRARFMPFAISDTSICNNNNKIDLSKGFDNIIFIGSGVEANEKFFNPNSLEPGSYTITAEFTDSMGCVSMDTLEVTLRIIPIVPVIERVASDQIVTADTYSSYQWYRNGEELNGKNGYHLRVHELGLYSVLVGNTENCFVGSEGYGFGIPVDEENVTNQENVKVYPNPTAGFLFVEMSDGDTLHTLSLTNNLGDVVLSKETNTAIARIDMNSLLPGTYYLQVNSFSTNVSVKIVKL